MALNDILEQIKEENQKKLEEINKEFDEKIKKIDSEYETKMEKAKKATNTQVETNSKKVTNKMITVAKMEAKNKLLKEKRKVMDEIFDEALNQIVESDDYKKLIVGLLKHAGIKGEDIIVVPAKGKEKETKEALEQSGQSFELSDISADIRGGFILTSEKVEIDNSFESILNKQLRDELELDIAKSLF